MSSSLRHTASFSLIRTVVHLWRMALISLMAAVGVSLIRFFRLVNSTATTSTRCADRSIGRTHIHRAFYGSELILGEVACSLPPLAKMPGVSSLSTEKRHLEDRLQLF